MRKLNKQKQERIIRVAEIAKHYVFYFFVFGFIGWLAEILVVYLMTGRIVNVGVLLGPWVPIYAWASVLITYLSRRIKNPLEFFVVIMAVTGIIEYLTSMYLEMVHHVRWWDYSGLFLNINGRICLWILAIFATIGVIGVKFIVPALDVIYEKINGKIFTIILAALMMIFMLDWIHSSYQPNMAPGVKNTPGSAGVFSES